MHALALAYPPLISYQPTLAICIIAFPGRRRHRRHVDAQVSPVIMTAAEHLRAAFNALLNGDLTERDRQCELAKKALAEEERLAKLAPSDPMGRQ